MEKDGRRRKVMTKPHLILWVRWAKQKRGCILFPIHGKICRSDSLQSTNSFTSFINVINLIFLLGEVKTFFNPKHSSYLYLLPSFLVNFLGNYLELCNIVTFFIFNFKTIIRVFRFINCFPFLISNELTKYQAK